MADSDFILAPQVVTAQVALEPVFNAFNSLMLLATSEAERIGLGEWIYSVASKLTAEEHHNSLLVMKGLYYAIEPDPDSEDFGAYITALANRDATRMRDQIIEGIVKDCAAHQIDLGLESPPEAHELLEDRERFMAIRKAFSDLREKPFDADDAADFYELLQNPEGMQALIVSQMRLLWEGYLAAEWERALPMLEESVAAYRQIDLSGMGVYEVIRSVTGRDIRNINEWESKLRAAAEIILVPSPHLGPYLSIQNRGEAVLVFFGARVPEGVTARSAELSRSELLVRLNALADDTRLRILELVIAHDELCAQDIINILDLSQSAASRHLRLLTASGYLLERRKEMAKCYSMNTERYEDTVQALKAFVKKP